MSAPLGGEHSPVTPCLYYTVFYGVGGLLKKTIIDSPCMELVVSLKTTVESPCL